MPLYYQRTGGYAQIVCIPPSVQKNKPQKQNAL